MIAHYCKECLLKMFAPFIRKKEISIDDFNIIIENDNIKYESEEFKGTIVSDKIKYDELVIIGSYMNANFLGKLLPNSTIYTYDKVPLIDMTIINFEGEKYYYDEPIFNVPNNVKQIFPPKKYWPY